MHQIPDPPWIKEAEREGGFPDKKYWSTGNSEFYEGCCLLCHQTNPKMLDEEHKVYSPSRQADVYFCSVCWPKFMKLFNDIADFVVFESKGTILSAVDLAIYLGQRGWLGERSTKRRQK